MPLDFTCNKKDGRNAVQREWMSLIFFYIKLALGSTHTRIYLTLSFKPDTSVHGCSSMPEHARASLFKGDRVERGSIGAPMARSVRGGVEKDINKHTVPVAHLVLCRPSSAAPPVVAAACGDFTAPSVNALL